MPIQKDYNHILMPLVTGLSVMLWGKTVLELTSRGDIFSSDLMADSYLAVMLTYAGAGEVEKWGSPTAWNPDCDPWTERAQRGGFFLLMWSLPFFAAYLWRLHDHMVPYPAELKRIWTGLFTIFLGKNTSRSLRHTRKGVFLAPAEEGSRINAEADLPGFLAGCPKQEATTSQVCAQFPDLSRRHITRLLTRLCEERRITRLAHAPGLETTYRLLIK